MHDIANEGDRALLLLELVHAATAGSSNSYCKSYVSCVCTSYAEMNSQKEQTKNSVIFLGEKAADTVEFLSVV